MALESLSLYGTLLTSIIMGVGLWEQEMRSTGLGGIAELAFTVPEPPVPQGIREGRCCLHMKAHPGACPQSGPPSALASPFPPCSSSIPVCMTPGEGAIVNTRAPAL